MRGGLMFGVDFVGGIKVVGQFEKGINESKIRDALKNYQPVVQQVGEPEANEYMISVSMKALGVKATDIDTEKNAEQLKEILGKSFPNVQILSVENVGPAVGKFLVSETRSAFLVAIVLMVIYLTFRFEFKYSVGAVVSLFHDLIITTVFCGMIGIEISIPVIAAMLTIFGYSVNDTIVIFDRIRENIQGPTKETYEQLIDKSISQTFARSLLTVFTTLIAVLAIFLIGGEGLYDFSVTLLFGISIGCFSSIYQAAPFVLIYENLVQKYRKK